MSFREKHKRNIEFLDRKFRERFGMTLAEFYKKIEPKNNPAKDDPQFVWSREMTGEALIGGRSVGKARITPPDKGI